MDTKPDHHDQLLDKKEPLATQTNPVSEEDNNEDELGPTNTTPTPKRRLPLIVKPWVILLIHAAACVALAMSMAFGLDGYEAIDDTGSRRKGGRLILRVSDVTTLVSVALVVIRVILAAFSAIALWASGRYMLYGPPRTNTSTVTKMVRWRLPPWLQNIRNTPQDYKSWIVSLVSFVLLFQPFIGPIVTGSVNWNSDFIMSTDVVEVNSVDPLAQFSGWYWYNQGGPAIQTALRKAAANANMAWANPTTKNEHGKSITGNGCRHIVNNDGLVAHSVLVDAILPCINIRSVSWFRSMDSATKKEYWDDITGNSLTMVKDNPFYYWVSGGAYAYDTKKTRPNPSTTDVPPPATVFSGTLAIVVLVERHDITTPPCTKLSNTKFGNLDIWPYDKMSHYGNNKDENCYAIGKVDFTAGVTRSSRAHYIDSRVVEDQTPIDKVKFEPNPWVQEAIWWLPHLMNTIGLMNTSQVPTWDNVDGYAEDLLRQAYLGAWDMLSHSFDEKGPTYKAYSADSRLVAEVSRVRVFVWMGLCLLVTVSGALLLALVLEEKYLKVPEEVVQEGREERKEEAQNLFFDLALS